MKVFRGQAKNLKRNIKQKNMKPLVIVFGILVLITLTYTSTHSVMGVGNTMFKEGNGKRRVRRGRQGFEGTTLNTAYRSGFREGGGDCTEPGSCGFEGGRSGFRENQCGGGVCDVDDNFTGSRVSGFEGFSSAKNAAPLRQGFVGRGKQGFKGRMRRRREGNSNENNNDGKDNDGKIDDKIPDDDNVNKKDDKIADHKQSFVGNRGRRRRR